LRSRECGHPSIQRNPTIKRGAGQKVFTVSSRGGGGPKHVRRLKKKEDKSWQVLKKLTQSLNWTQEIL